MHRLVGLIGKSAPTFSDWIANDVVLTKTQILTTQLGGADWFSMMIRCLDGPNSMQVSVIIPTFNRRDVVIRAVSALSRQNFPATEYEIIVVIDGSTDGTDAALRKLSLPCSLRIIEQNNQGPSAARNAGFRAAGARLLIFLDDDMLCDEGLIAAHVAALKSSKRAVGFGALFLSTDSKPSLATECFNREIGAIHLKYQRSSTASWQETDCVFSNASISRELFEESGGFDEAFRKREDLEFGIRLFRTKAQAHYVGEAIAYQHYEKNSTDLILEAEAFAEADVMFAKKHPECGVEGQLKWFAREPSWKMGLRRIAAAWPAAIDSLLAPVCFLGEAFFHISVFRNVGIRALQMRRRIHWLHKVLEIDKQALTPDLRRTQ